MSLPVWVVDERGAERRRPRGVDVDAAAVLEPDDLVEEGDELGDGDGEDEVGHVVRAALRDHLHLRPVGDAAIYRALGLEERKYCIIDSLGSKACPFCISFSDIF